MATGVDDRAGCILAALAAGTAAKLVFSLYISWQRARQFIRIGRVASLSVYPIKSCGGVNLSSATASDLGFTVNGVRDRHWLVTRENGDFLTQRQVPQLALVHPAIQGDRLTLTAPDMPVFTIPASPSLDRRLVRQCRMWEFHLEGMDCGDEAGAWFSKLTGIESVRLLYSAPELVKKATWRQIKPWKNTYRPGDQAAFTDNSAYHIVNEASLSALNERLASPVPMTSFRPSIVIQGAEAFDEDTWLEILIKDKVTLRVVEPCDRCVVTTIAQDKGVRDSASEPLETLRQFRLPPGSSKAPLFGINAQLDSESGTVSVGDPVFIRRK